METMGPFTPLWLFEDEAAEMQTFHNVLQDTESFQHIPLLL